MVPCIAVQGGPYMNANAISYGFPLCYMRFCSAFLGWGQLGEVKGEYERISGEEEENTDYGGMVKPS